MEADTTQDFKAGKSVTSGENKRKICFRLICLSFAEQIRKKLSLVGLNDLNQNSHTAFSSASSFCWFRSGCFGRTVSLGPPTISFWLIVGLLISLRLRTWFLWFHFICCFETEIISSNIKKTVFDWWWFANIYTDQAQPPKTVIVKRETVNS